MSKATVAQSESDSQAYIRKAWLCRALCRRYAFAEFNAVRLPVREGDAVRKVSWHWALGLFKPGEYEILGAWPSDAATAGHVGQDLHERGVERIGAVAGEDSADLAVRYPGATTWSQDSDTVDASQGAPTNPSPHRHAALRSAADTAERLQTRLAQAIKSRAPFADEDSAAAFLAQQLQKADRRFWAA
jgi:hypothetical protein